MNNTVTILLTILVAEISLVIIIAGVVVIKRWWNEKQTERIIGEFREAWRETFKNNYS